MAAGEKRYFMYRGVRGAVYAEVLSDTSEGITYGTVKNFTGLINVGVSQDSNSDPVYIDNFPAIMVNSTGPITLSLETSGMPIEQKSDILGHYYDSNSGMYVIGERRPKTFAFGYIGKYTTGKEYYTWLLKGTFSVPEYTSSTENNGTDSSGETLTFTGIATTAVFDRTNRQEMQVVIDETTNPLNITETQFFATVQTPDTIGATVAVTGVGLAPSTASVAKNATVTLTATVTPSNASNKAVTWESSDSLVATVENGVVSGIDDGVATITVTTVDGDFTDTSTVTVGTGE